MSKLAEITVLDVQMGLAIHVKSPNGKWLVIDMGSSSQGNGNEEPAKTFRYKDVAYMVLTHPHMDHISDILNFDYVSPSILRHCTGLTDNEILEQAGNDENARKKYQKYVDIVNRYIAPIAEENPNNPQNPDNYGGMEIQTFSTSLCDHSNINNFSVITVLTVGNAKAVICGDNETESLDILLRREEFKSAVKNAYILIAPHHGRESAFHKDFVDLVNPYVTIVSDGKYHDYSASDRYSTKSKGCTVYKRDGTSEERKCVTTRKDGNMQVVFGTSDDSRYSGTLYINLI